MPKLVDREPIEWKTLGCSLATWEKVQKIRKALEKKEDHARRIPLREVVDRIVDMVWRDHMKRKGDK